MNIPLIYNGPPIEPRHKCDPLLSCYCHICDRSGCRDCLPLNDVPYAMSSETLEACVSCFLKTQECA